MWIDYLDGLDAQCGMPALPAGIDATQGYFLSG